MKMNPNWSYRPYRPAFWETETLTITRLVPDENGMTVDWMPTGAASYTLSWRPLSENKALAW
jgi:hypothetical protein